MCVRVVLRGGEGGGGRQEGPVYYSYWYIGTCIYYHIALLVNLALEDNGTTMWCEEVEEEEEEVVVEDVEVVVVKLAQLASK